MHATASLAATVGHGIGTNAFRLMPTDPTDESGTGSQSREIEKRTTMNGKTTANYSADEAAIRDFFRALLDDRGRGNAFGSRSTEDAGHVAFDGSHTRGHETGEVYDVRFLAPDVAVAHAVASAAMRGKTEPSPERDSILKLMAVREGDEWRLAALGSTTSGFVP